MPIVYHGPFDGVDVVIDGEPHRVNRLEPVDLPDSLEKQFVEEQPGNWKRATKKQAEQAKEITE